MSRDLTAWLLEQIAEDERIAEGASPLGAELDPRWKAVQVEERIPGGMLTPAKFWMVVTENREATVSRSWSDIKPRSSTHIAAWDPARVLAECEAKRRMIALHRPVEVAIGDGAEQRRGVVCWHCIGPGGRPVSENWIERADAVLWPCTNMRLLALPYAGRPGYPEEWRP